MGRSDWEIALYVHHHIAELVAESLSHPSLRQHVDEPASFVTRLRRRLGIGLIQLGHALAGVDALHQRPAPAIRPAP